MCMMLPKAWVLIIVLAAKFLHPGPGYGGSCFPKDTLALVKTAEDHRQTMSIVESVVAYNDARKTAMAQRVIAAMGGEVGGRRIAILGLAFKPETDDMRDSPSLDIIPPLLAAGAEVVAYDPKSMGEAKALLPETVQYEQSALTVSRVQMRLSSLPNGTSSER